MTDSDGNIAVDFATLRLLSGQLEEILKDLNENVQTMHDRVEKVVLAWEGEAREAFIDRLDEWDRSARDLQATQAWLHSIVTTGQSNYAAAHAAVLRGWGAA
ncbi:WXG100 family type VII secretion target [Streptomyces sp. NPDC054945]|uniref:WXG100 family type VII secretion target n=1 Tax=Streptomyces sp. CG 926 TaxID=1882405 RepID=UPI000D6CB966|nr:WXG100 family type VII secretion target [Streptomyces sp. CG 926]PWK74783.1 WXG100 family type VII secretion target [Streptomyces sp. CG 926]